MQVFFVGDRKKYFGRKRRRQSCIEVDKATIMVKKGNPEGDCLRDSGDPDEIRTRVTAVKGRCLRPLDHRADGGCNWIRTNDTAGMNRML